MYAEVYIGDTHTFYHSFHHTDFVATDATGTPTYRVYEETTDTAILTGNLAKLDDTNTAGLYRGQITLSAANGFELDKCYAVLVLGTVTGNAQGWIVSRFIVRVNPKPAIRYLANRHDINNSTGAVTVYDEDGVSSYTATVTISGNTSSRSKLT